MALRSEPPRSSRARPHMETVPADARESALRILTESLAASRQSTRALARRLGLASHATLSRVLSGHKAPSFALLISLCDALRVEGRRRDAVVRGLAPRAIAESLALEKGRTGVESPPRERQGRRSENSKFFFDAHAPLVFEALKILGPCNVSALASGFTGPLSLGEEAILGALTHLHALGYVSRASGGCAESETSGLWQVVDPCADVVVPSSAPVAAALGNVRTALKTALKALPCDGLRLVRTSLTTVRVPPTGKAIDALRPLVVGFHDDVLALQGSEDDAVVQVVVSVVELARRNGPAPAVSTPTAHLPKPPDAGPSGAV